MGAGHHHHQAQATGQHLKAADAQSERLNLIVGVHAKAALKRLASCYGVTQAATIERLVLAAEHAAIDAAVNLPDCQANYYASKLKLPVTQ